MSSFDTILRGGTCVRADEAAFLADVGISHGKIAAIASPGTLDGGHVEDVTGLYVLPGVMDPHVHVGFAEGIGEYAPDTRAALIGGTTSALYILIQSNSYLPEVETHRQAIKELSYIDIGLHLTLMTDDHIAELPELVSMGVRSFKYYMSFRGDEGHYLGVEGTDDGQFFGILEAVAAHGSVLMVHPENIEVVWRLRDQVRGTGRTDLKAWGDSRPQFTEAEAVTRASYLAAQTGTDMYMVHLSGAEPLRAAMDARATNPGIRIYAETCPHFLTHHEDMDLGSRGKVNPPLRTAADNDVLWNAIADGSLTTVGSDHVPRRKAAKAGTIWEASAGFPGLATILPVLLTEGHLKRGIPIERLVAVASRNPARVFGYEGVKGDLQVGFDADLAVADLDWAQTADAARMGTYSDYSLYEDWELRGWPRLTYLRGQLMQRDGSVMVERPQGTYLHRSDPITRSA